MKLPPFVRLPPHADLFGWTARTLLDAAADDLPDLTGLTLVLPNPAGIAALRRVLLREARQPLLGPEIVTLDAYLRRGADRSPLTALDARLLLTELLSKAHTPFGAQSPWRLATELFSLFEELSANTPELAADEARFLAQLERGYGQRPPAALSDHAQIVHQLWRAYLQDTGDRSPAVAQLANLRRALAARSDDDAVVLIGCDALSTAAITALAPTLGHGVSMWLQREADDPVFVRNLGAAQAPDLPRDARADALHRAFDHTQHDPRERCTPSSVCRSVAARHAEHEARVVDLAIREAWLRGERDIVVVTEDRRLARRLRALLERAGIGLRDEVGWALSTSAAAASLGHWLDCVEQNFPYRATLALLKSAFFEANADDVRTLECRVYDDALAGNLLRLRTDASLPTDTLRTLEQAARILPSPQSPTRIARDWSHALLLSLQALPLWARWAQDKAGARLIQTLEDLDTALHSSGLVCDWHEFRTLLESLIEQHTFMPDGDADGVRLMTLAQATGLRCQTLIVAGTNAAQFPGRAAAQGMFKHEVRAELGLSHWTRQLALQRTRFLTLLHAAPEVLITYSPEEKQAQAIPCPWVQWLQALGLVMPDDALAQRAADARNEISADEIFALSPPPPSAPASARTLLPAQWSASAHQALIDCPYRFHARYVLGLDAREAPDRGPDARDYGERVHLILQAFHQQMPGLPPPYEHALNIAEHPQVAARLKQIADAVFAQDLRQRALARVWAARFTRAIPALAQWLCERAQEWPTVEVEQKLKRNLNDAVQLYGTVDRLERNAQDEQRVVDYKTGRPPRLADMESGENIQAVHYALLAERVVQVEYLDLAFDRKQTSTLSDDTLDNVRAQVAQRLININSRLHDRAALPANGIDAVCQHCDAAGLCRKGGWRE